MLVIAIIPKTKEEDAKYIVEATEGELDKISGIAEVEHIAGRIQVGHEIVIAPIYDKLDWFVANRARLKQAQTTLRNTADSLKNLLPQE